MITPLSESATHVLTRWTLLVCILPAGEEQRGTKTFVHRAPKTGHVSILRIVDNSFAGHIIVTRAEYAALTGPYP